VGALVPWEFICYRSRDARKLKLEKVQPKTCDRDAAHENMLVGTTEPHRRRIVVCPGQPKQASFQSPLPVLSRTVPASDLLAPLTTFPPGVSTEPLAGSGGRDSTPQELKSDILQQKPNRNRQRLLRVARASPGTCQKPTPLCTQLATSCRGLAGAGEGAATASRVAPEAQI
jgi:hypothetical protein